MSNDWIKHDGTCCPVAVGTWCTARLANGEVKSGTVHPTDHSNFTLWLWSSIPIIWMHKRVIAYRLPRSRAAEDLIARIRNLEPEKEPA